MEPALVLVYFPFLIALGAATTTSPFWSRLCKKLGDISYPLYVIHYPFLWIFLSYVEAEKPGLDQLRIVIPLAATGISVLAYLIMTYVDAPIRRYLMRLNAPKLAGSVVRSERVA
jgi:peptidoglycan/LPS O-acetylase OafA/YrhL